MKKLICSLTTVIMLVMIISMVAFADYSEGKLYYTVEDGSVTITGSFGKDETITVPAFIAGNPVNTIAAGAFSERTNLKTLNLPDTIMTIEEGALPANIMVNYNYNADDSTGSDKGDKTGGNTGSDKTQGTAGDNTSSGRVDENTEKISVGGKTEENSDGSKAYNISGKSTDANVDDMDDTFEVFDDDFDSTIDSKNTNSSSQNVNVDLDVNNVQNSQSNTVEIIIVCVCVVVAAIIVALVIRRRKKIRNTKD